MKKLKVFLTWVLCISLFFAVLALIGKHEESQAKVCSDKGMVIVRPFQGRVYCAAGSREGL